jgi:hypothetical protein
VRKAPAKKSKAKPVKKEKPVLSPEEMEAEKELRKERALKRTQAAEARYEPRVLRARGEEPAAPGRSKTVKEASKNKAEGTTQEAAHVGDKRPGSQEVQEGFQNKMQRTTD